MATIKEEIKKIYRESFPNDSIEFIDLFFNKIYRENEAMVYRVDGEAVSSLLLQLFSMNFPAADVPVGYLSAVATRRQFRNRGFMKELIGQALEQSAERGDYFATLIPAERWLYDYYHKFDFTTVFYIEELRYTTLHRFDFEGSYQTVEHVDSPEVYDAFNALMHRRKCCLQYSRDDFSALVADTFLDGGAVVALRNMVSGNIAGVGFAVMKDENLVVRDVVAADHDSWNATVARLEEIFPHNSTTIIVQPADNSFRPIESRAMARIVNVKAVLELFAANNRNLSAKVKISDQILPRNSHIYCIDNGTVTINDGYAGGLDLDVPVDVLTAIVFSSPKVGELFGLSTCRPYMSLMIE